MFCSQEDCGPNVSRCASPSVIGTASGSEPEPLSALAANIRARHDDFSSNSSGYRIFSLPAVAPGSFRSGIVLPMTEQNGAEPLLRRW
jgi:hypothetical protein